MTKAITTVGTSLFSNNFQSKKDYDDLSNFSATKAWEEESGRIEEVRAKFNNSILPKKQSDTEISAEVNSIIKLLEEKGSLEVILVASDTILSKLAAEFIVDWFKQYDKGDQLIIHEKVVVAEGLSVHDPDEFLLTGIQNLVEEVSHIKQISDNEEVILNITGGFKGVIPILTILGQIYDMPIYYIFEDSKKPIELQRLPINFDWDIIEQYGGNLTNPKLTYEKRPEAFEEMKNLHLVKVNAKGEAELTTIGTLVKVFLQRKPPHFGSLFGYFIEYKLKEYYDKVYGCNNVVHGFKEFDKGIGGDIDLWIKTDDGQIAVEIKPSSILSSYNELDTKIVDKFLSRCESAVTQMKEKRPINEVWLYVYSLHASKGSNGYNLTDDSKENLDKIALEVQKKFENAVFKVWHLDIKPNKINNSKRFIYQEFSSSSIKENNLKNIYQKS